MRQIIRKLFTPEAKITIIQVLLSLAVSLDWPLQQFDIKNVFLHKDLEEEDCMDFPHSFPNLTKRGKVCRLRKSMYELKQSPGACFGRFV